MKLYRSILFVPAHKPGWAEKAAAAGADAVLIDLEDAVPEEAKESARATAAESIVALHERYPNVGILVRPNGLDTDHHGRDIAAVVGHRPDALLLPMVRTAADIVAFDALATCAEIEAGLERGAVGLIPSMETAASVANCEELATASSRVVALQAAAAAGADIERDLGFTWTAEGLETLYLRSRTIVACRANGLRYPLVGVWQDLRNLDGLRTYSEQNRRLGFAGQLIIHPSHVPVVNDVYGLREDEAARLKRLVEAFEAAEAAGNAAVDFEGDHIDIAHARHAREQLARFGSRPTANA
ncbi:HpcH/HpaI aldolase/citrate lyase family protein [Nocardia vaccinii]|uniref:HpcH/HpaI aldolase/citrate lyase family protein n=1 Tax=Nocardia vaccinii TaxID=1822 RepID=UPI0008304A07|nr:CoA ester lyase [Nocardia vaccinii]